MNPSEQKIYDAVMEVKNDLTAINERQLQQRKEIDEQAVEIETLKADRNKVIGVSWFGGGLIAIGSLIYEILKHQ